MMRADSDI